MIDVGLFMNQLMRAKCLGGIQTLVDGKHLVYAVSRVTGKQTSFILDDGMSLDRVIQKVLEEVN